MQPFDATVAPAKGAGLKLAVVLAAAALALGACATAPQPSFPVSTVPVAAAAPARAEPQRAEPPAAAKTRPKARPGALAGAGADGAAKPSPRGYKIGAPYKINGRWYYPAENPDYDRVGVASWYGPDFHGRPTANGERFDMESASAAHTTLPLPSIVEVTNLENGRSIRVRLNDRGPYRGGRIIDLSRNAAEQLGFRTKGLARVRVRYVGPAPLDGPGTLHAAKAGRPRGRAGLQLASAGAKRSARMAKAPSYRQAGPDEAAPKLVTIAYKRTPDIDEWLRADNRAAPLW